MNSNIGQFQNNNGCSQWSLEIKETSRNCKEVSQINNNVQYEEKKNKYKKKRKTQKGA